MNSLIWWLSRVVVMLNFFEGCWPSFFAAGSAEYSCSMRSCNGRVTCPWFTRPRVWQVVREKMVTAPRICAVRKSSWSKQMWMENTLFDAPIGYSLTLNLAISSKLIGLLS